jgi:histidine triad (HIT) family protein
MDPNCTFCKIINHEIPAYIISENDNVIVFLSLENHPLVMPKKHIKDIYGLDEKTGNEIMKELIKVSKAVKQGLGCEGVYITQANESAAGQDVFHIHFHVYPRWADQVMNQLERVDDGERVLTMDKIKKAL